MADVTNIREDGIEYDPLGTVTITFDGDTYRLGRPKFGQWKWFSRRIETIAKDANVQVAEKIAAVEAAKETGDDAQIEAAGNALAAYNDLFYGVSAELVREMFVQLGDKPLPDDLDEWPVWLAADVAVPARIIGHWRQAPKASGVAATP